MLESLIKQLLFVSAMRFRSIRQVQKINKKKVIIHSVIEFVLTLLLLYSSFFIIGVPIEFIVPYIAVFIIVLYISNKYADKTLRFYKNNEGLIFVDLGWFSNFCYILATVTRIIITSLAMVIRFEIPKNMGIELGSTLSLFGETLAIFIVATIIFDFILIYGKATLAGLHKRMLTHYKMILSGKETIKGNVKEESK